MRVLQLIAVFIGTSVAVAAIGQGGRPPPIGSRPAPIKIGGANPSPTSTPITIGKPAPTPTQTPITIGKKQEPKKQGADGQGIPSEAQVFDWVLKQPLGAKEYKWAVGQPPQLLDPVQTHICLLTGVSGNFAGAGERVAVGVDNGAAGGPRWILSGTSGQAQLRATATCVEKMKFVPGVLSFDKMIAKKLPHHMNGACADHVAADGTGGMRYAHFISEMAGKWRGGGERLAAISLPQGGGVGAILVNGCSGFVDGALTAVATDGINAAKYWTPSGRTATKANATYALMDATDAKKWSDYIPGGGDKFMVVVPGQKLAPVDQAVCGIVSISGKFQGFGEYVDIVPEGGFWTFKIGNAAPYGGFINAAVRCLARDQR
jgi:hypothetical protein